MGMSRRFRSTATTIVILSTLFACSSGDSATTTPSAAPTFADIHGLGVDPTGVLYVATHQGLIRRAADGGWMYAGADRSDNMGFTLDPSTGAMFRSGHPVGGGNLGVEGSPDGATWTHLSDVAARPVDFHAMGMSFSDGKALYGWSYGAGAFRSGDGGHAWTQIDTSTVGTQVYAFAGTSRAREVLAGGEQGLFRSSDDGATWNVVAGTAGGWAAAIGADPRDADHALVSTQRGVKATADGGKSWIDAGTGIPADAQVTSIAISPVDRDIAYASAGTTVFATNDGGKTWTTLRSGS